MSRLACDWSHREGRIEPNGPRTSGELQLVMVSCLPIKKMEMYSSFSSCFWRGWQLGLPHWVSSGELLFKCHRVKWLTAAVIVSWAFWNFWVCCAIKMYYYEISSVAWACFSGKIKLRSVCAICKIFAWKPSHWALENLSHQNRSQVYPFGAFKCF